MEAELAGSSSGTAAAAVHTMETATGVLAVRDDSSVEPKHPHCEDDGEDEEEEGEVPVTLISGFLGSGKTFVMRHLLRHKCTDSDDISPQELRVGVVIGTNSDAKLLRRKEKEIMAKDVIRATHSCPCCVEEKLSKDLAALIQQGEEDDHESPVDRVLVECGWASPRTLRNRLQEAKEQGLEDSQKFMVDSMVSVVDASKMQELWESTDILADRADLDGFAESNLNGPPVAGAENYAKRRVAELLVEQLECADVVVLTKMELVPSEQRDFIRALLRLLLPPNAGCLVVPVESGKEPSPHLAERVWIDSDWERTVATNTNEDDYKDSVTRARESPRAREELLWWPPDALEEIAGNGAPITVDKCGVQVRVLDSDEACRAAVKACEGLELGSWEFDMMNQRLGAEGTISDVDTEDSIVEVNFGRWDTRVGINTFVYTRRRPFHPEKLEHVVKELPTALGLPCTIVPEDEAEPPPFSILSSVTRSKGFCWLATFHTAALYWDHSGGHFSLVNIGQWWAATDGGMEGHSDEFDGEFGDRRQEIVFIGVHLDIAEISKRLDACLLDDSELQGYKDHFMQKAPKDATLPGPLPGMPTHVPTRSPDDQDLNTRGKMRTSAAPAAADRGPHHSPTDTATGLKKAASVQSRHDEGNAAFRQKDYKKAVKLYSQAINLCDIEISSISARPQNGSRSRVRGGRDKPAAHEAAADIVKRKAVLFSNRAECYLRTGNYQKALADCDASLQIDIGNEKSMSRRSLAVDKIDDENRQQAEQAETRRKELEVARVQQEKDRLLELDRQNKREEEARIVAAELKQQQELTDERERKKQQAQRESSAETLQAAKAFMADAKLKMRDASRTERQAANTLATVERRKHDLHNKEASLKEKEARIAEQQRESKQLTEKLAAREAEHNSAKAGHRNGLDRRNYELDKREKVLRTREQEVERHRDSCSDKERELKRVDKALQERTRALAVREADLQRREDELLAGVAKAAKVQVQAQGVKDSARSAEASKLHGNSWREPSSDRAGAGESALSREKTEVSRFFPAPASPAAARGPEPPRNLCCPITHELMEDPVVASDGYTYERVAIEDWLAQCPTSPMSNEPMDGNRLIPNRLLKSQISDHLEPHRPPIEKDQSAVPPISQMQHAGFDGMPPLGLTPAAAQPYHNAPSGMSLAPGPKPKAIGKSGAFGATSFGDAAVLGHEDFNRDAFNQETFGPDAFGSDAFGNGKTDAFGLGASDQFGQDRLLGGIDMLGWQHNNVDQDPWAPGPTAIGLSAHSEDLPMAAPPPAAYDALMQESPEQQTPTSPMRIDDLSHDDMQDLHHNSVSDADCHDPMAIYVSNINWETNAVTLGEAFTKRFGPVAHVNLKENKVRRGPSYAFIVFESAESATTAVEASVHMMVDGRSLKFEARRRTTAPIRNPVEKSAGAAGPPPAQRPLGAIGRGPGPVAENSGLAAAPPAGPLSPPKLKAQQATYQQGSDDSPKLVRLFVGLGGGTTGDEQKSQLTRLFAQFGLVSDVEIGFMGCAFVTLGSDDEAKRAKASLHATTPAISGLARKQGLCVEVATQKGYETARKKAGKSMLGGGSVESSGQLRPANTGKKTAW